MKNRKLLFIALFVLFLIGLAIFLYPVIQQARIDSRTKQTVQQFMADRPEKVPTQPQPDIEDLEEQLPYFDLWYDARFYNIHLAFNQQETLDSAWAYIQPQLTLADYGLDSEVFGILTIPKLNLEMPIYLGANSSNLSLGAAVLGQTSLPMGEMNSNCVIAGHRGWNGADYFRYITELEPGDEVIITNLWETLRYTVTETKIIEPNDVESIYIQPGRDMVTLMTCHPFASGGKYRYLVYCDRDTVA